MKRIFVSAAFIVMGSMAFAQTPSKAKTSPAPATNQSVTTTPAVAQAVSHQDASAAKKEAKKECSDADKKQCGTKTGGKKSCCSHGAEATKEETK